MANGRRKSNPDATLHRLAWFIGLWLAGVAALAVVGYAIRYWLGL